MIIIFLFDEIISFHWHFPCQQCEGIVNGIFTYTKTMRKIRKTSEKNGEEAFLYYRRKMISRRELYFVLRINNKIYTTCIRRIHWFMNLVVYNVQSTK